MKRFLIGISTICFLSLLYVFQQTILLEESYNIHSNKKSLSLLIDQNGELRYNVAKLERLSRLEDILTAQETEIYIPRTWHKIHVRPQEEKLVPPQRPFTAIRPFVGTGRLIMSMFSLDTEAVANELSE